MLRSFAAVFVALVCWSLSAHAAPPNIVFFLIDDLGWADVGYHGSPFPTPNIDRLAAQGVELNQHYVAPVCSPTRSALLTGRYWSRFGVNSPQNNQALPFSTVTMASALAKLGYQTAISGKWHLGSKPEWGPKHFGFDWAYGSLAGGTGPYDHRYKKGPFSITWHRNHQLIEEEGHVTDLISKEATGLIKTFDPDRPFFLYVPFTAVHHPIDEPEFWLSRVPKSVPEERRAYSACVMHMDAAVGSIMAALEHKELLENTIVVFSSDNGGDGGIADSDTALYPGENAKGTVLGANHPLRGHKGQVYEGGIRVPAIASWKGTWKPRKVETPLHVVDWVPTLTALAGYRPEKDLKWDGRDIRSVLEGAGSTGDRELYFKGPGGRQFALRDGDWKILLHAASKDAPEKMELFHLGRDPNEKTDLAGAAQHKSRLAALRTKLDAQRARDDDAVVKQ